VDKP